MTWPKFWDQVRDEQEEVISWLKTYVSTWTENMMNDGFTPDVDEFLNHYPEYDHRELWSVIEKEMKRVESIILRDRQKMETPSQW